MKSLNLYNPRKIRISISYNTYLSEEVILNNLMDFTYFKDDISRQVDLVFNSVTLLDL